jgi:hypothetical protein
MLSPISRGWRKGALLILLAVLPAATALLTVTALTPPSPETKVRFASFDELQQLALSHGLYCCPGSSQPNRASGYFVSAHPLTHEEVEGLCKAQCGQTPAWQGVLWVLDLGTLARDEDFDPSNVGGSYAFWGRVFVAGDQRLMDQIEAWYRGQEVVRRERP